MVVCDRQRMAATTVDRTEIALEIHLPQLVGRLSLKPLHGSTLERLLLLDAIMTMQNRRDRAGGRDCSAPQGHQAGPQLAASPRRMPIPQLQHLRFDCRARRLAKTPRTT